MRRLTRAEVLICAARKNYGGWRGTCELEIFRSAISFAAATAVLMSLFIIVWIRINSYSLPPSPTDSASQFIFFWWAAMITRHSTLKRYACWIYCRSSWKPADFVFLFSPHKNYSHTFRFWNPNEILVRPRRRNWFHLPRFVSRFYVKRHFTSNSERIINSLALKFGSVVHDSWCCRKRTDAHWVGFRLRAHRSTSPWLFRWKIKKSKTWFSLKDNDIHPPIGMPTVRMLFYCISIFGDCLARRCYWTR